MNRIQKQIAVVIALVAIAAGAYAAYRNTASQPARANSAALLFAQTLPDASGAAHALAGYRGKVLVVNFWATWCVPCVEEIPAFSRVQTEFANSVSFVGIGIDSPSNIATFEKKIQPTYPLLVAGATGTELARAFGDTSGSLPFTVVIGADGLVKASRLGRVPENELRAWLGPVAGH